MRVMVVGSSGAGKSTFAVRLAEAAGLRYVELDLLNWGPNWYNRTADEPEAFKRSVDDATQGDDWVAAGGYSKTWPIIWSRAEHIVWLDLPKMLVMRQVIWRSLKRAFWKPEVFPGCRERPTRLFRYDHPIRWAWRNYSSRRVGIAEKLRDPAYAHLTVHHFRSRGDADAALARLTG